MTLRARPRILFVSDTKEDKVCADASVRHRCFNMSQELVRRGFRSHVMTLRAFEQQHRDLNGFDRYVMHRARLSEPLADFLLSVARERAVIDCDDLTFDVSYAAMAPAVRLGQRSAEEVRQDFASLAESMRLVDRATVSTVPLARHAQRFEHLTVSVVHDYVDPGLLGLARLLRNAQPPHARPFALGYFSGTATDDLGLQRVAPALGEMFRADPTAHLLVAGLVTLPDDLTPYLSRIRQVGVIPLHARPHAMSRCKKIIAPIEATALNECRSAADLFVAALAGCEVLATPVPDIERIRSPLLTTCTTIEEWSQGLLADRGMSPTAIERNACEIEAGLQIEAALPKWLRAVGLEAP